MVVSVSTGETPVTRVMIADDHSIVRKGLRALIDAADGWEVCAEAADGHEAVEVAAKTKPDVLVLDLTMPVLNGIDALTRIRKLLPDLEVLILTMHESDRLLGEALQAGARGYVVKNEGEERLMEALQTLSRRQPYFSPSVSGALPEDYREAGAPGGLKRLTPRERQTVKLVAEGKSNKVIAAILNVSPKTVETHRARAMEKIGARSAADIALYAVRNDLVQL